jgi:hypothetical protein
MTAGALLIAIAIIVCLLLTVRTQRRKVRELRRAARKQRRWLS